VSPLYPELEPYDQGLLAVGDGNHVYWETCGNPEGRPAVVLHGGPGSGCKPWHRRLFDPRSYSVVLLDQRGCGRSTPHASALETDLASNTTASQIADLELLRRHLDIDRWLVCGGSWGSTLALAYSEAYVEHVSALLLHGVTTGRHSEFDWVFRGGVSILFPEQWERLRGELPVADRDGDILDGYNRLLNHPDAAVRDRAAVAWCTWESATIDWPPTTGLAERFTDPAYRQAFARIVVHYARHNAWLEDGCLLRNAGLLADIPGILVHGRFDLQAPLANAWELNRVWPRSELHVVEDAGHAAGAEAIARELVRATDRFADA
jgi:proline iminopeptidase